MFRFNMCVVRTRRENNYQKISSKAFLKNKNVTKNLEKTRKIFLIALIAIIYNLYCFAD